jgi:DivIVA domain-containing protein
MRKKQKGTSDADQFTSPAPASPTPSTGSKMISPLDIQQKEFRVQRFGGYALRDVDEFLDQVTDAMSGLVAENERLRKGAPAGVAPVVGTADIADVNRQADEIIQRARDEAGRITAEAREQAAALSGGVVSAAGGASAADRAAINAFLAREKEFLQSLAGLVQGHAEAVKSMAKSARGTAPTATAKAAAPPVPTASEAPEAPEAPKAAVVPPEEPPAPPAPPQPAAEATVEMPEEAKVPDEAPVRVEEPEPATIGRGEADAESAAGDDSLRELFWGED